MSDLKTLAEIAQGQFLFVDLPQINGKLFLQIGEKIVQIGFVGLDLQFHPAVRKITHPAMDTVPAGEPGGGEPKSHALYLPRKKNMIAF